MHELPPCPDPDKYILVKTKEGYYWRRRRGTLRPARLNAVFANNVHNSKVAAPAARRIVQKLQPFLADLDTGRLTARIIGALIKSMNDGGFPDYRYLAQADLQHPPLSRLLRTLVHVQQTAHEIILTIPIDRYAMYKRGSLVSHYYFEAIALYGDMMIDHGLRIDSTMSPLYTFDDQPDTECVLCLSAPPATHPWMILLKASCQEPDRPSASSRHFGLRVVMAGIDSNRNPAQRIFDTDLQQKIRHRAGPISSLLDQSPSLSPQSTTLLDQFTRLPDESSSLLDHPNGLLDQLPSLLDPLHRLPDQQAGTAAPVDTNVPELPESLQHLLQQLGRRLLNKEKMSKAILALCAWKPLTLHQLSLLVHRKKKYLLEFFIIPLREKGLLMYTIPDNPNHPGQGYRTVEVSGSASAFNL
jgi:hypothetical protein